MPSKRPRQKSGCLNILIVEDDEDQLVLRGILLRENGFNTIEVGDAAAALACIEETKPGCVVMDLSLPTEDEGLQLIREVKRIAPATRIFVLTGRLRKALGDDPTLAMVEEIFTKGGAVAKLLERLRGVAK